jgi:DNA-binding response OmpR family regulator
MDQLTAVVIEDNMDIRVLIGTILQGSGYAVQVAVTGEEGVAVVRSLRPSLVTVDLGLPDRAGMEVISDIRGFTLAPILIISASNDLHQLELALAAGADGYLPKPFKPAALRAHAQSLHSRALNARPPGGPALSDGAECN